MSRTMKTQLLWIFGGLGVIAAASAAQAQQCGVQAGFVFNMNSCGGQCNLGPWYSYFPYEAYFQTPAPVCGYPNWPATFPPAQAAPAAPQTPANGNRVGYAPMYPVRQSPMQMVGYNPYGALDFGR